MNTTRALKAVEGPLAGSAALVTGGRSGIGLAICRRLAAMGAAVAVHVRSEAKAQPALQALGPDAAVVPVVADLATAAGCASAVEQALDGLGRLDILVNNAAVTGQTAIAPILEIEDDQIDAIVDVNLKAVIRCSRDAARVMIDGGVIVNIGSVAAYAAQYGATTYGATKAALIGLTRGLALELAERRIRVVHVAPGDIETATSADPAYTTSRRSSAWRRETPLRRRGTQDEIAAVVGFVCTAEAGFITGSSIVADGGLLSY